MSSGRSPWIIGALALAAAGGAGLGGALADGAPAAAEVRDAATIVRGAGDIRPAVARLRGVLGPDNGGAPGRHASGRREIDWDAVPDRLASPNALPGGFFNARRAPRALGARLQTPGDHVAVSADASNPAGAAVRFGDINPVNSAQFRTYSPQRLFSPIGSSIVSLRFSVPGTDRPAVVRGFGAVFTGVDPQETRSSAASMRRGGGSGPTACRSRGTGSRFSAWSSRARSSAGCGSSTEASRWGRRTARPTTPS